MTSFTFKMEEEFLELMKALSKKRALSVSAYLRTLVLADKKDEQK